MPDFRIPTYRLTQKQVQPEPLAVVALKCVGCGAALEIRSDVDHLACAYCGVSQVVERSGGVIALKRIGKAIEKVQRGTDRTAAELSLPRLQRELQALESEEHALLQGASAGLPARTNWAGGFRKLAYYTLLWVVVILFFGNHRGWAALGLMTWVVLWLGQAKHEPEHVLTAEGAKELERRTEVIRANIQARRERLQGHLAAARAILD